MDFQEIKKHICRICLDESVVIDWNATLYGYSDITYKDCYYKYTQMDCPASDPFSSMLCQICLDGLYNIHTLILKALESYTFFQEATSNLMECHYSNLEHNNAPAEFESVLMEKIKVEDPIIQDHFIYEHSNDELLQNLGEVKVGRKSRRCRSAIIITTESKNEGNTDTKVEQKSSLVSTIKNNQCDFPKYFKEQSEKSQKKARKGAAQQVIDQNDNISKNVIVSKEIAGELVEKQAKVIGDLMESKIKKKTPKMCSICSKILPSKYAVEMHEKSHMENRERTETCEVCGLKFYDKRNLYSHMRIHKDNREKIHKCEFCNKSFYQKGDLNIHRRIHLGQMISCTLCTKQFFRQIDVDRHMSTHSAIAINSDTKARSRYFVRCQYCNKSLLSTSFKSHTANHLNEPLMKCSICSKEFFRRDSCVLHVKKIHKKTNDEYNDFIILYKKNRITHLFLEQKAEIQYADGQTNLT